VWEFGTGELAASQADGACPIPYSAGSLVRCCTVHQTSTAGNGILDGLALNFYLLVPHPALWFLYRPNIK